LLVIGAVFQTGLNRIKREIDYLGAIYLTLALSCIILFTSEGGSVMPWAALELWLILLVGLLSLGGFIHQQRRAVEPIIPLHLFRQRTFLLSCLVSFIVGMSLFGAMTFLPLYLQIVKDSTPAQAGMQLTPLMGFLLVSSIISGRIISKTGKYRRFPIVGTLLAFIAIGLLTTLKISTPMHLLYLYLGVLGCGLGMVM